MKHSTPILSAVRAMHAHEDAGRDPYNSLPYSRRRADPVRSASTPAQMIEAREILKCYETVLTLADAARANA